MSLVSQSITHPSMATLLLYITQKLGQKADDHHLPSFQKHLSPGYDHIDLIYNTRNGRKAPNNNPYFSKTWPPSGSHTKMVKLKGKAKVE